MHEVWLPAKFLLAFAASADEARDGDSFSAEYIHNYPGRDDPFFGKPILFTIPWWLVAVILVLFHWLVWKIRKKKRK